MKTRLVGADFGVFPLLFLFHICNDLAQLSSRSTANNESCMWFFAVFFLSLTTKRGGALGVGFIGLDKSTHGNATPEKTALHTGI